MRRLFIQSILAITFACAGMPPVQAQTSLPQIQAGFLMNFVKFVEWQPPVTKHIICTLGDDRFENALSENMQKLEIDHEIRRNIPLSDIVNCTVVFVSHAAADEANRAINKVKNKQILTVADVPAFTKDGGMIELTEINGYVRFRVNQQAFEETGMKISAKLIDLAIN
jgi:hypothetical protein